VSARRGLSGPPANLETVGPVRDAAARQRPGVHAYTQPAQPAFLVLTPTLATPRSRRPRFGDRRLGAVAPGRASSTGDGVPAAVGPGWASGCALFPLRAQQIGHFKPDRRRAWLPWCFSATSSCESDSLTGGCSSRRPQWRCGVSWHSRSSSWTCAFLGVYAAASAFLGKPDGPCARFRGPALAGRGNRPGRVRRAAPSRRRPSPSRRPPRPCPYAGAMTSLSGPASSLCCVPRTLFGNDAYPGGPSASSYGGASAARAESVSRPALRAGLPQGIVALKTPTAGRGGALVAVSASAS